MIDVQKACEIATAKRHEPFVTAVIDVGRGYVVDTTPEIGVELETAPVFVDKKTGETSAYFIPTHWKEFKQGKICEIPAEFR